jgi:ABC-type nickel/cobalt efflux system permease component RcnA
MTIKRLIILLQATALVASELRHPAIKHHHPAPKHHPHQHDHDPDPDRDHDHDHQTTKPGRPTVGNGLADFPSPIQGINLGGWLILEDWLNTDMFVNSGIPPKHQDQYHFDQLPNAKSRLRKHWNTYITEADFDDFQTWGINA